jgi:phospholipid/cholesterol/gamma-HCH transport system substrate-binding protein
VAITSPPSPPAPPPPAAGGPPPGRRAPARPRRSLARPLALGALALVALIVAYLVLAGGEGTNYHIEFAEADQLVRGDQVQVGGVPVGSITGIELTKDDKALVTIHIEDSLTPLHEGTTAEVRVPSLSSVANRYIALSPGPNNRPAMAAGARLPASVTKPVTDLDQLFNTFNPKTLKGLKGFIQGFGEQYAGAGQAVGGATEYFAPSIAATDHFFQELALDQPVLTGFLVETAKALTTIGARKEDLSGLIEHANQTFKAVGSEQSNLAHGLHELPRALRTGNKTFAELPSTFGALKTLVNASKPTSVPLRRLFSELRPLVVTATPVVSNFSRAINLPGANNDLTDYARALPGLVRVLSTATPSGVTSLRESVPITAFFGPYSPELEGLFRTFGQTAAYYDANGHYARLSPVFPDFAYGGSSSNNLIPTSSQKVIEGLKTGQLRRCPGAATQPAADGSSPFVDGELLTCDPTETLP